MGYSVMLWGAEKLVPAEYWCPYGTAIILATNLSLYCKQWVYDTEYKFELSVT